ncbi:NUDIX hydrolase [Pinisolibacter sp.]|uniref:NUDIX hydrolase n=1 Tax=Pinisolibacter sp. TaxID=2172024 RepID=UPI002FDEDB59
MPKPATSKSSPERLPQIAALPMRKVDGRVEVCLVTTRETGRWTVPKGWPMKGVPDHRAAAIEAEQEAGVVGKPLKKPLGTFDYWKRRADRFDLVRVTVYRLKARKLLSTWKEMAERQVRWMSLDDAATAVDEPGLKAMLRGLEASAPAK